MASIKYYTCSNGHIVLERYMPESGFICNVSTCGERREERSARTPKIVSLTNNLLTEISWGDDASYSEAAMEIERFLVNFIKKMYEMSYEDALAIAMWGAGVSLPPEDCDAYLLHGPDHNVKTNCYLKKPHEDHETHYHNTNTGYTTIARWRGDEAVTGEYDQPPEDRSWGS